jgi:hypothetical protein
LDKPIRVLKPIRLVTRDDPPTRAHVHACVTAFMAAYVHV